MKQILNQDIEKLIRQTAHGLMHNLFAGVDMLLAAYSQLLPATRTSNPISKLFRPILQHRKVKAVLGAQLVASMLLVGTVSTARGAGETFPDPEMAVIREEIVEIATQERLTKPVETMGVSQGFHNSHRGIDLRARLGTPIYPIADGVVKEISYSRFAYGHYVLIDHQDGLSTLYAHMGRIEVKPGEKVVKGKTIGAVGLTGWTTGAHLHLEVYENGRAVNPGQIISL